MNPAVNFVLYVLPNLPKLDKPKTKGEDYYIHKAKAFITESQLATFYGGGEMLIDLEWDRLYALFSKEGLEPTHYREYWHYDEFMAEPVLTLEIISKERVK